MVMGWRCLVPVTSKFQARTKELAEVTHLSLGEASGGAETSSHTVQPGCAGKKCPLPLGSSPGKEGSPPPRPTKSGLTTMGLLLLHGKKGLCFVLFCFPEFPSPSLHSQTETVMRGQNVSLSCFLQNISLEITYFLFRGEKCLQTQDGKGEPMTINLTVSEAHDLGPYKCKVQVANCSKYSHPFKFTFAGK